MIAITDKDRARVTINSSPQIFNVEMVEIGEHFIKFVYKGERLNIPITGYTVMVLDDFVNINITTDVFWQKVMVDY